MKKFKTLSDPMKIAYIGAAGAIIAAIIGAIVTGIFLLVSKTVPQLPISPTVTNTPVQSPQSTNKAYSPYEGTLALNDPISDNSKGYNWDINPTTFGTCTFTGGAYQVAAPSSDTYHRCIAENTNFSNFIYEVELTISTGDCGGILFRAHASLYHYYYFRICQNGSYSLWLYTQSGVETKHLIQSTSPVITTEYGQSNLIAVVANNDYLALYVNHQLINSTNDNTFSQGQIGVAADSVNSPTEVAFRNAKVWRL